MSKTIVFDLGGVLIDWNPRYLYRSYFETECGMEYFLSHICTMDWNEAQDGGRTIEEANKILIDKYPAYSKEILAYYSEWETMLKGSIQGTVEILKSIRQQSYKVYALTNWSAETFPIAKKQYDFLDWFDGILVSGIEKLKKPDPRIYNLLLEKYDLVPSDCLFIDDNLRNVTAAIHEGIPSIKYENSQQLKAQLIHHGIIV